MAISLSKAKALCTASELSLVVASGKETVKLLSMPQLRLKIERARKLRDKWRDQATKQTRAVQAKLRGREAAGNARSAEKAALFGEVLSRFEAELARPKSDRGEAKRARKATPLKMKGTSHRADRAEIRGALKETKLALKAAGKAKRSVAKTAAAPAVGSAKRDVAGAPSSAAEAREIQSPASTKVLTSKKTKASSGAKAIVAQTPPLTAGLQVSKRQQIQASTRAKQNRLKAAGVVRIQKHTSARNKRRQGKRDSR